MKINHKLVSIIFLMVCSGLLFSYNNAKKPEQGNWSSLSSNSSLKFLKTQNKNKGVYNVQVTPILNALGKAKIKEPVLVLFKIGNTKNLVSLGKYLPNTFSGPKGGKQHIQGVEPTTFPVTRPIVWKQVKMSLPPTKLKRKQINITLIFKNTSGKVMAKIASKLLF